MDKKYIVLFAILIGVNAYGQKNLLVENNNRFAFDIYKNLAANSETNMFFSPISISTAIGMTYTGAQGETKNQVAKVFYFPENASDLGAGMGSLQKKINGLNSSDVEMAMVNNLWPEKSYGFKRSFIKQLKKSYSASAKSLDFVNSPEKARAEINRFISDNTKQKISELLPEGSISSLTRLVLTNAIYFKGKWEKPFSPKKTKDTDFYPTSDKRIRCQTMAIKETYNYYENPEMQVVELPYKGKTISMLVFLPAKRIPIDEFVKQFTYDEYKKVTDSLHSTEVMVLLPKFKNSSGFQLKPILSSMGMPIPFSDNADFSGMSNKKDLKISDVYHKSFIDVAEEGVEAAAATAVVVAVKAVLTVPVFSANRPFVYLIRDNKSGSIIFMGRLNNPNISE